VLQKLNANSETRGEEGR